MGNKRIILLIGILLLIAGAVGIFLLEKDALPAKKEDISSAKAIKHTQTETSPKIEDKEKKDTVKANLYSDSPNYLPFVSIAETAQLPAEMKQKINAILELSQGCYYLKTNTENKGIFVILQNPAMYSSNRYPRHNLQIAEINSNGTVTYKNLGFTGEDNEIENAVTPSKLEKWTYDETTEPARPLTHTVYDKKNKVLYSEKWNYDDTDPVKYEMDDGAGKVVSVMKETLDDDTRYRQEHIFYDEEGNTIKSMTVNYDGADIQWFTYYDANHPQNSVMIESVYEDGLKKEEKIYNQNFKLEKTLSANYENGERTRIKLHNAEGEEILNIENQ
jgi:hypothetical protein